METPIPRLYRLQSMPGHFYAGHFKDGTQAFMSVDYRNLIAVLFDTEGRYLKTLVREISPEMQAAFKEEIKENRWAVYRTIWRDLDRWATELGFTEGVIAVQKFDLPEYDLRIQDIPQVYQDILDSGQELDEEMKEQIRFWQEDNDYVLVWGDEYDIDQDGEVVST